METCATKLGTTTIKLERCTNCIQPNYKLPQSQKKKKISHIYFPACSVHADSDTAKHIQHGNVYMYTTPATASRTLTRKPRHISTPTSPSQSHPPHDSVETHTHTHTCRSHGPLTTITFRDAHTHTHHFPRYYIISSNSTLAGR